MASKKDDSEDESGWKVVKSKRRNKTKSSSLTCERMEELDLESYQNDEDGRDPTTVYDERWMHANAPDHLSSQASFGKWMVFCDYSDLNASWRKIKAQVISGRLGPTSAKCSTKLKDPTCSCHSGGVIEVFTTQKDAGAVGMKLINICGHGIKYKTNKATAKGFYTAFGEAKTSYKTFKWNNGRGPSY